MRRAVMGCIVGSALALSAGVLAGEKYLGTIYVYDGGTSNNCETTTLDAGLFADGGVFGDGGLLYANASFSIPASPSGQPITVVCPTNVYTLPDVRGCDAGRCPPWYAGQWLPTTTTPIVAFSYTAFTGSLFSDAGLASETRTCSGGLVAISPMDGGYAACQIFTRSGNE